MPRTLLLKIGGSVATYKDRPNLAVRTRLLKHIAQAILASLATKPLSLILIHGSGSAGHGLAHTFGLKSGAGSDPIKIDAALRSQRANQELDGALARIFLAAGLPVVPIHSASVILQTDGRITSFFTDTIAHALAHGHIPLLYGEMVPDTSLNFSICSGDAIAAFLAQHFSAERIAFASDIDGVFTADPHHFPNATLIERLSFADLSTQANITGSHCVDVTGGLLGKLSALAPLSSTGLQQVEIFQGLKAEHYRRILLALPFPHTTITF